MMNNNRFVELFEELVIYFEKNAAATPIKTVSTLAERIATLEEEREYYKQVVNEKMTIIKQMTDEEQKQRDWEKNRADRAETELKRLKLSMRTLTCQTDINMEALMNAPTVDVKRMTKDRLARELAEKLVEEMTVEEYFDYYKRAKKVRASITIVGGK